MRREQGKPPERGEGISFYEKGTGEASREGRGYLFFMRRDMGVYQRGVGLLGCPGNPR